VERTFPIDTWFCQTGRSPSSIRGAYDAYAVIVLIHWRCYEYVSSSALNFSVVTYRDRGQSGSRRGLMLYGRCQE
jgi:hypothetical protein